MERVGRCLQKLRRERTDTSGSAEDEDTIDTSRQAVLVGLHRPNAVRCPIGPFIWIYTAYACCRSAKEQRNTTDSCSAARIAPTTIPKHPNLNLRFLPFAVDEMT